MRQVTSLICILVIMMFVIPSLSQLVDGSTLTVKANGYSNSEAFVVIDSNTGKVIRQKNPHQTMYPASLTKIVTAIITIELANLDEKVIVSEKAPRVDGTRVYLLEDEEITFKQLLEGLMVSSGNDAAIAIAEHMSGSVEKFSHKMNQFVREEIGVENTNFTNPHGLFDKNNKTTAYDLAKISAYAMKNDQFRKLVGTKSVEWNGEGWETTLYNHHPLTRMYDDVIGIKNGYVRKSGYTLATAVERGNTELITITLNSPSRSLAKQETMDLINDGFEHFETQWVSFESELELADYEYPKQIPITAIIGETLRYTISSNGYMTIRGQGNRLINLVVLEEKNQFEWPISQYETMNFMSTPLEEKWKFSSSKYSKEPDTFFDWLFISGFYTVK